MSRPLDGIRVLDWTIWQQGPVASAMLGDLGAEVIKLEERVGGDPGRGMKRVRGISVELPGGRNFYIEHNNRNKKSITLDLRKEKAREIVCRLVEKSDVFVQNFRKGVAQRLGVGYDVLSRHNPKLIYATASGYGPNGPDAAEPAFDYMGLARSGIMHTVGEPGMPPMSIVGGVADQMGAITLAYGVLAALVARERFGIGQEIDVSHLGSMINLQGVGVAFNLLLGKEMPRQPRSAAFNPLWNHYQCGDGKWLALAHLQPDRQWASLCRALGLDDLADDPRYDDALKREQHCAYLVSRMDEAFASRSREEWMKVLKEKGDFIYTVVNSVPDLVSDPQVTANEYIVDFDHPVLGKVKMVGSPVRYSKTPAYITKEAPEFGEHTEEVLTELAGYSWEEVAELKAQEVI